MNVPPQVSRRMQRHGFSLIEVILATAILLGSVVVLSELAGIGRRQANRAERIAEAQRLCALTLHEMLLGLRPIETVERDPLLPISVPTDERPEIDLFGEIDPVDASVDPGRPAGDAESEWAYSVRFEQIEAWPSLTALTVEVEPANDERPQLSRFSLTRWIDTALVDPAFTTATSRPIGSNGLFAEGPAR